MGEAFFLGLGDYFVEPHQHEKLSLLSQIERSVVDSVRPLLTRHGLQTREDAALHAIGREHCGRFKAMTWQDFLEDITVKYPDYMVEFFALEEVAPIEDRPLLEPFTRHEIVAIAFAKLELAGAEGGAGELRSFLRDNR